MEHPSSLVGIGADLKVRRPARSRNGCLTCRRRKVRCNEQRPRCAHCARLSLECTWRQPTQAQAQASIARSSPASLERTSAVENLQDGLQLPSQTPFTQFFDLPGLPWQDTSIPSTSNWLSGNFLNLNDPVSHLSVENDTNLPQTPQSNASTTQRPQPSMTPSTIKADASDEELLRAFLESPVQSILMSVETQIRWPYMKKTLVSMSKSSKMVRCAIIAFVALLSRNTDGELQSRRAGVYKSAAVELSETISRISLDSMKLDDELQNIFATVFFVIKLVTGRAGQANEYLNKSFRMFQMRKQAELNITEKRLISWIRLIDARAALAGGDGSFVTNDNENIYASDAFHSRRTASPEPGYHDTAIEEILFDTIHRPGAIFFQKVLSFMGRISKIDPWHRSRGTVKDETEVMAIASQISQQLLELYTVRPPLMDYAVAGHITQSHIMQILAVTITQNFRAYLANYYACFIHLHRVAYKSLPRTEEVIDATSNIKGLSRDIVSALGPNESMPVSMLWALVMWGSEEEDATERVWILETIRRMESTASNAHAMADVLGEVQKRQDQNGQRVDIQSVMRDIFDQSFALL
ncbi:hypothetical protein ASPWEDRAFT_731619 [Aspergillus wentii DTO 134E9]|uniref:Zn(2)-C6 fungal-type domain-containing protein n=1 Tax=Aspergillus wentii DTO 134E9 TaxID=1073089 RepID=A0A1L9S1C0_ASPWE|nr:uncharacterized protein ASPWEDRAFT_731619 [Aspergillus wentii DTO 134E9]OJJ40970.1 hypothetical protein ASPWEDRAFT_731619 [Aspergillus wentii DTO 134E9]